MFVFPTGALEAQVWNLLWTGEVALKESMPILKKAGFEILEDLPRTAVGFSSKTYKNLPPQLRMSTTSNGEQRILGLVHMSKDSVTPPKFLCRST